MHDYSHPSDLLHDAELASLCNDRRLGPATNLAQAVDRLNARRRRIDDLDNRLTLWYRFGGTQASRTRLYNLRVPVARWLVEISDHCYARHGFNAPEGTW